MEFILNQLKYRSGFAAALQKALKKPAVPGVGVAAAAAAAAAGAGAGAASAAGGSKMLTQRESKQMQQIKREFKEQVQRLCGWG